MSVFFHVLLCVGVLGVVACDTDTFTGRCTTASDCPIGAYCRPDGLCACRSHEACKDGQFCNGQGICQDRAGCRANSDCQDAQFCDLQSGDCIDRTACGGDVHCPQGMVCHGRRCIDGCRDDADCPLYGICQRTGSSTASFGRCAVGQCSDKTYCEYGAQCVNQRCARASNPNHCAVCNNTGDECGSPYNYCLVNSNYDASNPNSGSEYYCGVECSQESDCPSGYNCGNVILLTQKQCERNADCAGTRECVKGEGQLRGACTCENDADCSLKEPAACIGSCGGLGVQECTQDSQCRTSCVFQCRYPEGRSCQNDGDCEPRPICADAGFGKFCLTTGESCARDEDCLCVSGKCAGLPRRCRTGADCLLRCQDRGCLLGSSCAPSEGLSCPDVRP